VCVCARVCVCACVRACVCICMYVPVSGCALVHENSTLQLASSPDAVQAASLLVGLGCSGAHTIHAHHGACAGWGPSQIWPGLLSGVRQGDQGAQRGGGCGGALTGVASGGGESARSVVWGLSSRVTMATAFVGGVGGSCTSRWPHEAGAVWWRTRVLDGWLMSESPQTRVDTGTGCGCVGLWARKLTC